MTILVTGSAGFIGFHLSKSLLEDGFEVHGFDSLNDYYDPYYKNIRLEILLKYKNYKFSRGHLEDNSKLEYLFNKYKFDYVIHLAAQAGVRYSLENPKAYINSNILGFQNVIDQVRYYKPKNFVYASSSSVYGSNKTLPFSENQSVENPISLYAATKISNELVAKTYGHLFGIPSTGLRFFTVYGPYARPDMALFKFAEAMRNGNKLSVFNNGEMFRDFTYIDDIVNGIKLAMLKTEIGQVFNLGRGRKESLLSMIRHLESNLCIKAELDLMPMQPGDVSETVADISKAKHLLGYDPKIYLNEGIKFFSEWYKKERMQ